jgi:hypothetical protein
VFLLILSSLWVEVLEDEVNLVGSSALYRHEEQDMSQYELGVEERRREGSSADLVGTEPEGGGKEMGGRRESAQLEKELK